MSLVRYEYTRWKDKPGDAVEFERETASCLFDAKGRKTLKKTNFASWHETVEEVQALIDQRLEAKNRAAILTRKRAAAEEMFDALVHLLEDTEHKDHNCGDEFYCPVLNAEKALAKARGEL